MTEPCTALVNGLQGECANFAEVGAGHCRVLILDTVRCALSCLAREIGGWGAGRLGRSLKPPAEGTRSGVDLQTSRQDAPVPPSVGSTDDLIRIRNFSSSLN